MCLGLARGLGAQKKISREPARPDSHQPASRNSTAFRWLVLLTDCTGEIPFVSSLLAAVSYFKVCVKIMETHLNLHAKSDHPEVVNLSASPQLAVISKVYFSRLRRPLRSVWIRSIPGRLSGVRGGGESLRRTGDLQAKNTPTEARIRLETVKNCFSTTGHLRTSIYPVINC